MQSYNTTQNLHATLIWCIMGNASLLITLIIFACCFGENSNNVFMKYGPQPTLVILGISIDSWPRYVALQVFIMFFQITDTLVNEFASPILEFNVYNPDKVYITEFTKFQLQFYCQSMWFVNNMKSALMLLISISQVDVAVSKVIYAELAAIYTIRTLINKKKFGNPVIECNENTPLSAIIVES